MKKLLFIFIVFFTTTVAFSQTARVQVIHNSADALASEVDVYVNSDLAIDDFAFRTATPFIDLPAGVSIDLSIAPSSSTDVGDAVLTVPVTLAENETYVVVADGIISPTGYNPSPAASLQVYAMGREMASNGSNTDVLVHHGATDAPTVDVVESGVGAGVIVDDISYSEFQGYLELPTADYVLQIQDASGTVGVAAYGAPLSTLALEGQALVVLASGFLDPSQNSNGPEFGLWVALASGGALIPLPPATLGVEDQTLSQLSVYPNPTADRLTLFGEIEGDYSVSIIDVNGRVLLENKISDANRKIRTSNLDSGIYLLTITSDANASKTIRFVKQ
ncbi:DUF4397 domain-containing protein [Ulvibacter litoralis]|uniref:Por secretion system C-terminal sorting domain-containing protein n=1 Tax=Ulvibacter litoralis TaxID=227084 RepID=A0A1G7HJN5_9FLAO|nr:DUF4397 domain-containing protein [Ulvibacter litoralis]GHC58054.1 hypothetical protein GCM10008083_23390 [Ulvibacter litoralis]SDF00546.1 Por secretion system C-terminal sorting domain-containing protein [Ulvibacter litoralis]